MWFPLKTHQLVSTAISLLRSMVKRLLELISLTILCTASAYAVTAKGMVEWLSEEAEFTDVRQIEFHAITNATGKHLDNEIVDRITETLRDKLNDAGIVLIEPGTKNIQSVVLKTSVIHYKPGSVGARWIGFGMGAAVCILRSRLIDGESGKLLGDFIGAYQVEAGGLFSAGAHLIAPKSASKLIAERIVELFGLKKEEIKNGYEFE